MMQERRELKNIQKLIEKNIKANKPKRNLGKKVKKTMIMVQAKEIIDLYINTVYFLYIERKPFELCLNEIIN